MEKELSRVVDALSGFVWTALDIISIQGIRDGHTPAHIGGR